MFGLPVEPPEQTYYAAKLDAYATELLRARQAPEVMTDPSDHGRTIR